MRSLNSKSIFFASFYTSLYLYFISYLCHFSLIELRSEYLQKNRVHIQTEGKEIQIDIATVKYAINQLNNKNSYGAGEIDNRIILFFIVCIFKMHQW